MLRLLSNNAFLLLVQKFIALENEKTEDKDKLYSKCCVIFDVIYKNCKLILKKL